MHAAIFPVEDENGVPIIRFEVRSGCPAGDQLRHHVGGLIDAMDFYSDDTGRRLTAWVHDEGRFIYGPTFYLPQRAEKYEPGDQINVGLVHGPAIITAVDPEGETVGLTPDEAMRLRWGAKTLLLRKPRVAAIPTLEFTGPLVVRSAS